MGDGDPVVWQLLLQLLLISVNAVFACAEIAIIAMKDTKISKLVSSGDQRAVRLEKLTEQPSRFLATIQVGVTLAGFLGSAFAANSFSDRLVTMLLDAGVKASPKTLDTISVVVITFVLSYFTLVFGELVPKRIAMRKAEQLALAMSRLVYTVSRLFAPLVWLLTVSTNGMLRLLGIDPLAPDETVSEEEIRMMVDAGRESGAIDSDEREIIHNVFEFDDKSAFDVMTHRTEVLFLWTDDDDEAWRKAIVENRHSFYPVCSGNADNIIGILDSKEYYRLKDRSRDSVMNNAVRPAYFVPDSVKCDLLFRNMKKQRKRIAVVLDEYGGMSGIVTMNDLVEELVGDFDDDFGPPAPALIERIDDSTYRILGSAALEDVSRNLGVPMPEDEFETFGGLVFGALGAVPEDGSTPELTTYGLSIKVSRIHEHRIESASVRVLKEDDVPPGP